MAFDLDPGAAGTVLQNPARDRVRTVRATFRSEPIEPVHTKQALLHHLQALDELPAEYIIHPRIVLSRKTGEDMLRQSESAEPTPALRELMRGAD